jgi:hypothetical protein
MTPAVISIREILFMVISCPVTAPNAKRPYAESGVNPGCIAYPAASITIVGVAAILIC